MSISVTPIISLISSATEMSNRSAFSDASKNITYGIIDGETVGKESTCIRIKNHDYSDNVSQHLFFSPCSFSYFYFKGILVDPDFDFFFVINFNHWQCDSHRSISGGEPPEALQNRKTWCYWNPNLISDLKHLLQINVELTPIRCNLVARMAVKYFCYEIMRFANPPLQWHLFCPF